jgi:TolB-like protein
VRNHRARIILFDNFQVDLHAREIHRDGVRIGAEEKPLKVLELLIKHPGEVVSRKALREKLWPNTTVAYEQNLNTAVNKLRVLLRDSARRPRFIETLPRRGYRFRAFVQIRQGATSSVRKRILVVLPFENFCDSAAQGCFAEGLTEDLTFRLAQLDPKRLGIIARTSAVQYKRAEKSIRDISRELKADYVIEGSVRRERRRIRITAQLIGAKDQTHLWSATYDRVLGDILSVQQDVSQQISRALASELLL